MCMYVQEVVDLQSPQNLNAGSGGQLSASASAWEAAVTRELSEGLGGGTYTQVACKQLVGIVLLLYVKTPLVRSCHVIAM